MADLSISYYSRRTRKGTSAGRFPAVRSRTPTDGAPAPDNANQDVYDVGLFA